MDFILDVGDFVNNAVVTTEDHLKRMHTFMFFVDGFNTGYFVRKISAIDNDSNKPIIQSIELYGPYKDVDRKFVYMDDNLNIHLQDKDAFAEYLLVTHEASFTTAKLTVEEFKKRIEHGGEFCKLKSVNENVVELTGILEYPRISEIDIAVGDQFIHFKEDGCHIAITIVE